MKVQGCFAGVMIWLAQCPVVAGAGNPAPLWRATHRVAASAWSSAFTQPTASADPAPAPVAEPTAAPPQEPQPVVNPLPESVKAATPQTLASFLAQAVTVDDAMPKALATAPKRVKLVGYAPDWCVYCWEPGQVGVKLRDTCPLSWLKRHPGIDLEIKVASDPECEFYPAVRDAETRRWYFRDSLLSTDVFLERLNMRREEKNLPKLMASQEVGRVGSIDKATVETVLGLLGDNGSAVLGNESTKFAQGLLTVSIPAGIGMKWSAAGGATRFVFDPAKRPTVGIGPARQAVTGVTITADSLTLNIDWFPDVSLDIE